MNEDKLTPVELQAHMEREAHKFWLKATARRTAAKWEFERDMISEGVTSWDVIYRDTGWRPD